MMHRDTPPSTQEFSSGDSSEGKRWEEFMDEFNRKKQREKTDIDEGFIDREPVLVIADMVRHVGKDCPHLVRLCESVDTRKDLQSVAAGIDIALHEMSPEGLYDVAKEIKDNYYEWNAGRFRPLTGSRVPHADSRAQYLYESMAGVKIPKEVFYNSKFEAAANGFSYFYDPDSPRHETRKQIKLSSGKMTPDELREQMLRSADEHLYDALRTIIEKGVIKGTRGRVVFLTDASYCPQLITRLVTTLEVYADLPQGTLLKRVDMNDLFNKIGMELSSDEKRIVGISWV